MKFREMALESILALGKENVLLLHAGLGSVLGELATVAAGVHLL